MISLQINSEPVRVSCEGPGLLLNSKKKQELALSSDVNRYRIKSSRASPKPITRAELYKTILGGFRCSGHRSGRAPGARRRRRRIGLRGTYIKHGNGDFFLYKLCYENNGRRMLN
ncbi:hypothetical protein EVAR_61593_1 [Eumeta japonica]|uniref:Uncharacterized protein n=1 Tax=Eumeta variegata TaxID=151549 RepID=A0A4C1YH20_EUMVA|nr:hypothetical protein EVAR_61593_1 [Eumeta japonica]